MCISIDSNTRKRQIVHTLYLEKNSHVQPQQKTLETVGFQPVLRINFMKWSAKPSCVCSPEGPVLDHFPKHLHVHPGDTDFCLFYSVYCTGSSSTFSCIWLGARHLVEIVYAMR